MIKRNLFYQNIFVNSLLIFFKNSDIIILEFGCYVFLQLSKLGWVTLFQCLSKVCRPKLDSRCIAPIAYYITIKEKLQAFVRIFLTKAFSFSHSWIIKGLGKLPKIIFKSLKIWKWSSTCVACYLKNKTYAIRTVRAMIYLWV